MKRQTELPVLDLLTTLLRVFLGVVFIFASIDKISDPDSFAGSVGSYRIVSGTPALLIATVLPWIELLCGLGLLLGIFIRGSALLIVIMLAAFSVLVVSALWRGLDISCGCFTQDPAAGRIGMYKVGENLLLLVIGVFVLRTSRIGLSLERLFRNHSASADTDT